MAFTIKSFEQIAAELAVTIAVATASTPAQKYARAQAALQVATAIQPIGQGNFSQSLAQIATIVTTKITDPGVVQLVNDLFNILNIFLAPLLVTEAAIPGMTSTIEGVANNVIAGITVIASQYPAPSA